MLNVQCEQYASVVGKMKVGNIVPRAGLEPASLAFQVSVLPLHLVGSLMSLLKCYAHAYLSMQLLASEVRADYYSSLEPCAKKTQPLGIMQ